MVKKIIATLVLAFTFSYLIVPVNAADKSTTSNAVTSFYGEYVDKTDNTEPDKTPPVINQGHTGKPSSNTDNTTHDKDYPSHKGNGTTTTVHNKKEKILPQTGDSSKGKSQLSGISLLLALSIVILYIKQKGE